MTTTSGRKFAFIVNQVELPNPFLVEISRRTKTLPRHVAYYEPCVFYCLPTMTIILKSSLLRYHRSVVKQSMVTVLQEADPDIIGSESQLRTIAVEAIVSVEAWKTRNKRTRKQDLISECRKLRAKQVRDEAYLQATFLEDVNRSLTELKFLASSPK
jgi:hypothetical protein